MTPLAGRLAAVRRRIERAGGDPDQVAIVAVTKGRSAAECREAVAAGLTVLGENRVQEGLSKMDEVDGARWHLIGNLQSNKIRHAAGRFELIQSLDDRGTAELIARRHPHQEVLVQVNVARESQKHGCSPDAAVELVGEVARLLRVSGLMCMGPATGDPRPAFEELKRLRDKARERTGAPLPVLSMGMSGDFEAAVAAGSSMLRLGRVLFGGP